LRKGPNYGVPLRFSSLDEINYREFMTFSSLEAHLSSLYRLRRFGIQLGLTTISRLVRGLGNPQNRYTIVHVAGTNGKGSIAAFLSSILVQAGYKVGLYTSPHLLRFNERIQVNGRPVSDRHVVAAAEAVQRIYMQGEPPTFFECATAMAFYHFALAGVEVAVIETGMGGRYDATNVVNPAVSIISNVSMEHTEYLGKTLAQIAREKAGIIKRGAGVVTGIRQKNALKVVEKKAEEQGVSLKRLGRDIRIRKGRNGRFSCLCANRRWDGLRVGLLGTHQIGNAALALGALEFLEEKGIRVSPEAVLVGLEKVRWPGRLEMACRRPLIILDGAHNPAAIRTLSAFLKNEMASRRLILVAGILADKAWKTMLRELATVADRMIVAKPKYERAADPGVLASFLGSVRKEATAVRNVPEAVSLAMKESSGDDAICITGSLYTVGEAKAYLNKQRILGR
jgi:dihydrofolate synthase/folylpolyglutamate synthase